MNTTQDDGGPAFPHTVEYRGETSGGVIPHGGLSLRDWFAGMALPEAIRLCAKADKESGPTNTTQEYINMAVADDDDINTLEARLAYAMADAMLAARKKQP